MYILEMSMLFVRCRSNIESPDQLYRQKWTKVVKIMHI